MLGQTNHSKTILLGLGKTIKRMQTKETVNVPILSTTATERSHEISVQEFVVLQEDQYRLQDANFDVSQIPAS